MEDDARDQLRAQPRIAGEVSAEGYSTIPFNATRLIASAPMWDLGITIVWRHE
jgi:hypothetical protein